MDGHPVVNRRFGVTARIFSGKPGKTGSGKTELFNRNSLEQFGTDEPGAHPWSKTENVVKNRNFL